MRGHFRSARKAPRNGGRQVPRQPTGTKEVIIYLLTTLAEWAALALAGMWLLEHFTDWRRK